VAPVSIASSDLTAGWRGLIDDPSLLVELHER